MIMKELAERYNQFQHDFGQNQTLDYGKIIERLFAPHFKKVVNGNELVHERQDLLCQLETVRNSSGSWSIQTLELIPSADNKKCTIWYCLESEKAGKFFIMAILTGSHDYIDRIDEIYYQQN